MIVWLLHGCRLEVTCNFVQIFRDANVPVAWKRGMRITNCSSWWRISEKVLLSVALNHSPLQQSLTANFTKHPPEQADYISKRASEGGPGCTRIHLTAMNPSLHTSHRGNKSLVLLFLFSFFLTILYRRITTTAEWRSLWKCDIFSAVNFLMQVPVSSLHYTFPLYFILTKSAPLLRKRF